MTGSQPIPSGCACRTNELAMGCTHVLDGGEAVLLVTRQWLTLQTGRRLVSWRFLCGRTHKGSSLEAGRLVCVDCMLRCKPSLTEVADLPIGYRAVRVHEGSEWMRTPMGDPN